jgi:hypothetical protein
MDTEIKHTEIIQGAHVLHSPQDKLLSIIALKNTVVENLLKEVETIAKNNKYSKISAIIPRWCVRKFTRRGYSTEAVIPKFYKGKVDGYFLGKFIDSSRSVNVGKYKPATGNYPDLIPEVTDNPGNIAIAGTAPDTAAHIISSFLHKKLDNGYYGGKYDLPEYTQRKYYTFSKNSENLAVAETIENSLWGTAFISRIVITQNCDDKIYACILEKLSKQITGEKVESNQGTTCCCNAHPKFKTIYSNIYSSNLERQKFLLDKGFKSAGVLRNHTVLNGKYCDLEILYSNINHKIEKNKGKSQTGINNRSGVILKNGVICLD